MEDAVAEGLTIANNLLANQVQFNLDLNQSALSTITGRLSSGLRVNTAADDPSGLAIATNLQVQADGFNTAVHNVQNANNAAQVALGAFTTTTDILQRIRDLAVEAASDINSANDRGNLQVEISQLLLEVNRISQNTSFNGQALLDGSHAGFQAEQDASLRVTSNASLASVDASAGFRVPVATPFGPLPPPPMGTIGADYQFLVAFVRAGGVAFFTTPNANTPGVQGVGGSATVDGSIQLQVVNTGVSIAVVETFIQSATGQICTSRTLFSPNSTIAATTTGNASGFDNVAITLGSFTTPDVGATAYIKVSQNVVALTNPANPAFNFQSGAAEGDVIQVGIEATNTASLRISNLNVAISSNTNPSLGAEDVIGQVDNALKTLLAQQAQLGAVVVRLNEDANNDDISSVNLQAAESSIRDLNVGPATTDLTKVQILVSVGTAVLAQANANARSVLELFKAS
jgi:flagellin